MDTDNNSISWLSWTVLQWTESAAISSAFAICCPWTYSNRDMTGSPYISIIILEDSIISVLIHVHQQFTKIFLVHIQSIYIIIYLFNNSNYNRSEVTFVVALIYISPTVNHIFIYLLVTSCTSFKEYLSMSFVHFLNWVEFFPAVEFLLCFKCY